MNKKEIRVLDDVIQDLCEKQDRVKITRQILGINTDFDFLREVKTIESLYANVLQDRKRVKSSFLYASTSGWTVQYIRNKKQYKKGEKFWVNIYFSFVETDNYE